MKLRIAILFVLNFSMMVSVNSRVISTDPQDTIKRRDDSTYPINNCSYPKYPQYSHFRQSFCRDEKPGGSSWMIICGGPQTDTKSFNGTCREGWTCKDQQQDAAYDQIGLAWCTNSAKTSVAASSDGFDGETDFNFADFRYDPYP